MNLNGCKCSDAKPRLFYKITDSYGRNTMFDEITEKIETVMDQLNGLRGHL
jgi:hypothetical protein